MGFKSHIPIKDIYNFSFALPSLFVEYDPNKVKKEKVEENEKKGDEVYLFGNEKEPCILRVKNQ